MFPGFGPTPDEHSHRHIMYDESKEPRFAPPPLLKRTVMAGFYGRKSGKGFYDYSDPKNPKPMKLG